MDDPTRAPGYDLFKLIVAVILLILALILMWMSPPQTVSLLEPTATPFPLPTATGTPEFSPTPPPPPATTESPAPEPSPTPSPPSAPTETAEPKLSPTPPPPAETLMPEITATPLAEMPAADACETATSHSQLKVGTSATIRRRLNFRSSPGIRENWLQTNMPGTPVKVIGGPECVPYWTGAYLWWQIQLPDGRVGWSAEGSLRGSFYFMEPR